ncbi:hypothetical protein BN1708_016984, partial [Verticillium longisporum]
MDDSVPAMTWPNLPMDNWQDLQAAVPPMQLGSLPHTVGSSSPTGTFLEVLSLASSNEGSWIMVGDQNNAGSFNQFQQAQQNAAIFNPGQTLHLRTNSDSSDGANSFELGITMNNMTFNTSGGDAFWDLGDDQRQQFQQFTHQMSSNQQHMASTSGHSSPQSSHGAMPAQRIWPMPLDMSSGAIEHSSPPESHHQHHHQHHSSSPAQSASPLSQSSPYQQPGSMLTDFALQQHLQQHQQSTPDFSSYISDPFMPVTYDSFASNFAPINPISYLPATTQQLPT